MKFSEIVAALGDQVTASSLEAGGKDLVVQGLAALEQANADQMSYVEGEKFASLVATTGAGALVLPDKAALQAEAIARNIAWVTVKNPRMVFSRAIALFYQPYQLPVGIHPTAVIDSNAQVGKHVAIGPNVVVSSGVKLGDRVCIHPNVVVYPDVIIGADTILHANCTIHERTQIGTDCMIHSGAVIGAEGFGFVPTATGWEKMHQSGITVLEDRVEVGCNSAVDRPAVGETRVGQDTKIDNMVHIAHGCQIGQGVAMAAQVGIAGGVTIGNRVILAGQVGVANQAVVGDGVIASAKAGIHNNIPAGETVSGMPAIPHNVYLRAAILFKKLPEMAKTIKAMQKQRSND
ncbi:MAG: UDP-3-O-(3-hydroxymyristoyl)glucosamine N-acyltransferase [Phormidesmis sp.]